MKQQQPTRSPFYSVLSTFLAILLLITSVPFFVSAASYLVLGACSTEINDPPFPEPEPEPTPDVTNLELKAITLGFSVTVPQGETLYLNGTDYKLNNGPYTSLSAPFQIFLESTSGQTTKIVVEKNSTVYSIAGPNANVELSFNSGSTLNVSSQSGGNIVHTDKLKIINSGTLNIIGSSSVASTELRTNQLAGDSFNLTTSPNHVFIADHSSTGGVNFNFTVGRSMPSGTTAGVELTNGIFYPGSNLTVNSTNTVPNAFHSNRLTVSNNPAARNPTTITVNGGGDVGLSITDYIETHSTIIKSGLTGTSPTTAFSLVGEAKLLDSPLKLQGRDYGLYANNATLNWSFNDSINGLSNSTVAGSKAGLYLKNSPNANSSINFTSGSLTATLTGGAGGLGAIYIDGSNTDLWFNGGDLHLISLSQVHKGALLTYRGFKPTASTPYILRMRDGTFTMEMPHYENGYLWGLDLPTAVGLDSVNVTETYTDLVTIYQFPTKPYATGGDYLNYNWQSAPLALGTATSAGFTTENTYKKAQLTGTTINSTQSNGQALEFGGFTPAGGKNYKVIYSNVDFLGSSVIYLNPSPGTVSTNLIPVKQGMLIGALPLPQRAGHRFTGWYDAGGTRYTSDMLYPFNTSVTLLAGWEPLVNPDYIITYYTNGATTLPIEQLAKEGSLLTPPPVERYGYTFEGWYKESDFRNKWDFARDRVGTSSVNLYAKWTATPFPVTFVTESGITAPAKINVAYGTKVPQPTNPYKKNYTFLGWFYTPVGQTQEVQWDFTTNPMIGAPLTLTARWRYNGNDRPTSGSEGTRRSDGPVYFRRTKATVQPSVNKQTVVTNPSQQTANKVPTTQLLGLPQGPLPQTGFAALRSASIGVTLVLLGGILLLSGSKHRKEDTDETSDNE